MRVNTIRLRTLRVLTRRLALLLAVGLLTFACNRSTPPTATPLPPTATVVATATNVPTGAPAASVEAEKTEEPAPTSDSPASSGIANQGAIFISPRFSYTVILPCCWLALPTPGTAIESALAEAEETLPGWGDLTARMRERETGAILELIALLPDNENLAMPVAQVTVSVLPSNGLTLDGYLVATQDELNSIANTHVITAHVDATLGVGHLPASVIEYTAEATPAADDAEEIMAGLQVAFFGESDDDLIVLTFTTTSERFEELQPQFLNIVRTVTLNNASVRLQSLGFGV